MSEPAADASGSSRRADMAPVPRSLSAGCRFNDLSPDILIRLLSRLDARQAVQTCVLSLKWRDLWRDVPRIHASRREFEIPDECDVRNRLFQKFVNCLLMLRNPVPLEEFRLTYSICPGRIKADSAKANLWICHALLCNAPSVEVISLDDRIELDNAVFTSICLTSLRFDTVILDTGFFSQLQTGCQALKSLILQNCAINDTEISSQTLKFLSIGLDCSIGTGGRTSISVPSLTHFRFFGLDPYSYSTIPLLKNMESLEIAYIILPEFKVAIEIDDIRQFLKGLSSVTTLDFYYAASVLKMEKNQHWCPKFCNLKFLTLGKWCLFANYYALIVFLQNSPNLVKLTLQLEKYYAPDGFMGELEKRSFTCKHLNTVEIICVEGDRVLNSLEEFLLASGITPGQIRIKH